jgi:glycosyltransferase involved in cell wall biosynthesis
VVQADDDPILQDRWLGKPLSKRQVMWERSFERMLYRSADRLWFSAQTAAELMCSLFDVPLSRAECVPNGAVAPADGAVKPNDGLFRFAYTGALLPDTHGVKGLMDAFGSLHAPHARLVLAGPEGEWIPEHLAQSGDSRVLYLGCHTAESVQSVLTTCDAGVLTGQRGGYHDTGLPGKLGAYFAAGLPVIATCGGEGARIIEQRHVGIVCDERDLGSALDRLVHDVDAFTEMRANAMAVRGDYVWDRIYERAVAGLGVGPPAHGRGEMTDAPHPEALASEWQGGGLG